MWDWELLKNRTSNGHSEILAQFGNEDFRYTHAVSHGSSEDEYCLHNHAMYELVYCVGGEAVFLADGVRYQMRPGSLLVITPTVPHKLFLREETPFERHILYVYSTGNASELSRLMGEGRLADQSMGSAYYEDVQRVDADFDRISETSRSSDETIRGLTPLFVRAFAADLLITMRQRDPLRFSVGVSRKIDSILLYLNQHFTADLTLQGIADRFFLSRDYCNRLFHKSTGMTVMYYVKYSRVLYARQLLADGMSATDAAAKSGFQDYSSFYRAYRRVTGRSPSDDYQVAETASPGA